MFFFKLLQIRSIYYKIRMDVMDLHQLRIIQQAALLDCNLTRVAQAMHTSQPGISRHIRDLEEELGVELFVRQGKRLVGMTPPGRELLEIAGRILTDAQNIGRIGELFGKSGKGILRAAGTPAGISRLPQTMARFHHLFPDVRMTLSPQRTPDVALALLHDEADIGIAGEQLHNFDIATFPFLRMEYQVVIPVMHPLARSGSLSLESLADFSLLTYSAGLEERLKVDRSFSGSGMSPNIVLTADTGEIIECARHGAGVAIVCGCEAGNIPRQEELAVLDARHLFEGQSLLLGIRRGKLLRDFERHYIRLLRPDFDLDMVQQAVLTRKDSHYVPDFTI